MSSPRKTAIQELNRELKLRENVYPKQIASGNLNRQRAEKQYKTLRDAMRVLEVMKDEHYNYYLTHWKEKPTVQQGTLWKPPAKK